jgi:hypothetical protein
VGSRFVVVVELDWELEAGEACTSGVAPPMIGSGRHLCTDKLDLDVMIHSPAAAAVADRRVERCPKISRLLIR